MNVNTCCKFVSHKVNKIRWLHISKDVLSELDTFVTGSWDDLTNNLSVWQFGLSHEQTNTYLESDDRRYEPKLVCSIPHRGIVRDILCLSDRHLLSASSSGSVTLYSYENYNKQLEESFMWPQLHGAHDSCTAIASQGDNKVVTVGEDGGIHLLQVEYRTPLLTIENADDTSLNGVCSLQHQQIATVNTMGQLKVWDLRQQLKQPASILSVGANLSALFCVDQHPTQPHTVAAGGQDGSLAIWDLRQEKVPITLLAGHSAAMWELHFHRLHPDHLFSCSQDGSVWHWNSCGTPAASMSQKKGLGGTHFIPSDVEELSSWLAGDAVRHRLDVTSLLPSNTMSVNSIDSAGHMLLCGTDGEQIVAFRNLTII